MRPFAFTVGVLVTLFAFTVLVVVGALVGAAASVVIGRIAASRFSGGALMREV